MANQYLSRLGIVLGMDTAELEKGVNSAIQETKKLGRELKVGATAAQNEIIKLTYATQDLEKPLTAVAKVTREMNDPAYKLSKATQDLKNEVLKAAAAYDLAAEKAGKLKQAQMNAAGQKAGLSAYQMQALSYQTTDIITSLAGGQNPMLVLLQQGGQLKDQFGGLTNVFNAFRQVMTLSNVAMVGLGATAGGLIYAAYKGQEEFKKFNNELALTSYYSGLSYKGYQDLAYVLSTKTNSAIHDAKTVLGELSASGKFTEKSIQSVGEAILNMSRLTGRSADEITKELIPAFNGTASAAAGLNDKYHFLSLAQYKHITMLEREGKLQEAAKTTADALNASIKKQANEVEGLAGFWRETYNWFSKYWDKTKQAFSGSSDQEKMLKAAEKVAELGKDIAANQSKTKKLELAEALKDYEKYSAKYIAQVKANAKAVSDAEEIAAFDKAGGYDRQLALQTEALKQAVDDRINVLEIGATQQERIEFETRRKLAQAAIDFDRQIKEKGRGLLPQEYAAFLEKVQSIQSAGKVQTEELNRQQRKQFEDRQAAEQLSIDKEQEKLNLYKENVALSETELQLAMNRLETEKNIKDIMRSGLSDDEKQKMAAREEGLGRQRENVIQLGEQLKLLKNIHDSVFNSMTSAVETFVKTGKFAFKDFTKSVILDIFAIYAKAQMLKMLGGASGFIGSLFSAGTNFLGSSALGTGGSTGFGINPNAGGFGLKTNANGGSLPANSPSIVGERGAELFIPNTSGTIIPNNQIGAALGGSTVVNNYNINAIDTQSFAQALASNKNAVFAANQSASRGLPASR